MGSPLGPILADLFLGYYETLWLNTFKEFEIILYIQYLDDIMCLYNCESDADKFFEFLNTQQFNIKFAFEKQVNKQMLFLDVLITNDGDQFCTSIFCKETAVGLFTNFSGFTPFSYKVGIVRTLLHCTFMISSTWFLFHEEVVKIKHYLEENSYPLSFFDKQVKFFLENKINEYCKSLNIKIVITPFKVADMFNMKDPIPKSLKSFVVYKFVCPGCNASYIGETTHHSSTRIKEHLEIDKNRMNLARHIVLKNLLK